MNEIIYLDNAATMQKSDSVISAQVDFLQHNYANAGRGVCARSAFVDTMVNAVRGRVADFIGADENQIVFVSGATDGLNRVVRMIGGGALRVAVSDLDHNSAWLPWQMRPKTDICEWPLDDNYNLDMVDFPTADVYVLTAMSNVMGVAQDVQKLSQAIRSAVPGAIIIVDAAQYVVHEKIDANAWGADFICWSGHKIGADTGVGVMYVREPDRWNMDKFGGGMVRRVTDEKIEFVDDVTRFEAGTLPLTQIAGLGVAIDEIERVRPDLNLIKYMYDELSKIERIGIVTPRDATLLSFVVDDIHPLDFGTLMGARNVCVRVGNMCAPNIVRRLGCDYGGLVRISVGQKNTMDEVKKVVQIIKDIVK